MTSIAADQIKGNVFVAGFGDGVVRLFDKRNDRSENVTWRTWRNHHTWIQSVHMPTGQEYMILSARYVSAMTWLIGSMNGEVRIWDSRAGGDTPLYESVAQPQGLMGLAVHNSTPVFAT
jgi:regulator-associated protein of mTOR